MENATREIYWNISRDWVWLMYAMLGAAVFICLCGLTVKIRSWLKGQSEPDFRGNWPKRLWGLAKEVGLQVRIRQKLLPGIFHSSLLPAFGVLLVVTLVVFIEADFGVELFRGRLYIVLSFLADLAGFVFFAGLVMAMVRRFIVRPESLERMKLDALLYAGLLYVIVSGFLLEALRIAATQDPWSMFSPVGWALSFAVKPLAGIAGPLHAALWWTHMGAVAVMIATLPWSRLVHTVTVPLNIMLRDLHHAGHCRRVDVEPLMEMEDFQYGLGKAEDLTWKQRMDLDSCIGCGRCEEVCPSFSTGGSLSPRKFIAALKGSVKMNGGANGSNGDAWPGGNGGDEMLWRCRTCYACAEACPSMIDHVRFMVEIRQNETMINARLPADASMALQSMQVRGNPWGPQLERTEWLKSNNVRVLGKGEETDVLYWLGCCTSYDETKQEIAMNTVKLLQAAGVEFSILGDEELCCGDPARILGDEGVFQEIVHSQLEKLNAVKFGSIVSHCPHCYHILKNEYPWFGAVFNVVHHSELLLELLRQNRLKPIKELNRKVVFHDPCYLGRYQGIFDAPREMLGCIPGVTLAEMESNRHRSLCCGGGGGHYWMDLKDGRRIGEARIGQAMAAGADTLAVGCVYCMQMLNDSVKAGNLDGRLEVVEIVNILAESVLEG
ncbi:MAG: heterodisulfide reductase-related iron-sulfur binding cluster [Pseudomonadota bacterium]